MSKISVAQDGSALRFLIPKKLNLVTGTTTPKGNGGVDASLKGRFRLLDNAVGADAGPWADTSGNGGSATLIYGDTPTRIAAGLEAPASGNGFVISSGVLILANFTIVMTVKTTTDDYLPAQIQGFFAPSNHGFPAVSSDSYANDPAPFGAMKSTITGNDDDNSLALWDKGEEEFGADNFKYIPQSLAPANEYNTIGIRFLAAAASGTGHMDITTLGGGYNYARTVALANYFAAFSAHTFAFGIWPAGLQRPADGVLCAFDIWTHANTPGFLDRDTMLFAMKSQAIDVADRGVTIIGYND